MKKSSRTKEDMIHAVIQLIEENGSTDMTIGMIAQRADVAVGLINYHYESKEALIIDAVNYYIEEHIRQENVFMLEEGLPPRELFAASFQAYADFCVKHSILCRLHIRYCLDGKLNGSTMKEGALYYLPILRTLCPQLKDTQLMTILAMITSALQLSFLQAETIRQTTGVDFFDKNQRDQWIEQMILLTIGEK